MKALVMAVALLGCATVDPYLKPIASCAGKAVSPADAQEAFADLLAQNWTDLAAEGVRLGYDVLACIIGDIETQAPGLRPSAAQFRQLHAVEFRAAGMSEDDASVPYQEIGTWRQPRGVNAALFARPGGAVSTEVAPPSGCLVWQVDRKNWRNSRWVALR